MRVCLTIDTRGCSVLLTMSWYKARCSFRIIPLLMYVASCVLLLTTILLRPFVRDYPGEPVPEETFTHPPSWSSSSLYQLLPSTTIHSILLVQVICLAIFLHNLSPRPLLLASLLLSAVQLDLADKKPHRLAGCTAILTESVAQVQLHTTALYYTAVKELCDSLLQTSGIW